ncbi:MAG: DUF1295 domain-containing protein [Spirulina sp. SIO3F2]|nr:DUF1295 domain-containing protein [Spirulina sp. SIO3F2]
MTADAAAKTLPLTQLDAINLAKVLTILLLIVYAFIWGISDWRQVLYLALHITYCVWWLLEQWLFPTRRQQIFQEPTTWGSLIGALLVVGGLYSLPGYFAFTNPHPLSLWVAAIAVPLYTLGSLVNATADVQKLTAKQQGAGLVQDGAWRIAQNINYLGDLMRYLSFSIVAGALWAYLLPVGILLLYIPRILAKETRMQEKYPDYAAYRDQTKRLLPGLW